MPASTKSSSSATALDKTWPVYRYTKKSSSGKGNKFSYYIPPGAGDPDGRLVSFVKSSSRKGLMKVEISVLKDEKNMPKEEKLADIFLMPEENRPRLIETIEKLQKTLEGKHRPLPGYERPQTTQETHIQFLVLLKEAKIITDGSYKSARDWFEKSYNAEVGLGEQSTKTTKYEEKTSHKLINKFKKMGWGKRHYTRLGSTSDV